MGIPKDYKPVIRPYAGGMQYCIEHKGYYINADGVPERENGSKVKYRYTTRGEAQKALNKFNNKGNVTMNKKDLKTGMLLKIANGELFKVLIGTTNSDNDNGNRGNIALASNGHGWLYFSNYNEDLTNKRGNSNINDIVAVYKPTRTFQNIFTYDLDKCDTVWERVTPPTVMTIAELEKQLGITNLQIKD